MSHALQVFLDDADHRALRAWAEARGWTLSQVVRVAVRALVRPKDAGDPLLAASGLVEGLPVDLSQRVDEYLLNTFVAERPVSYGTKPVRRHQRVARVPQRKRRPARRR